MDILRLEDWYLKNQRKLSFRETKDPYRIWVSEIMLQQTQVESVLPYFERFIQKYPTIESLSIANEQTLHKNVEGLGYYNRFRNMQKAAQLIVNKHHGIFPNQYQDVIDLPGIGRYTAGAIMSIAYNAPYSALDGNVIRVLSRYLGNDLDMRIEKNKTFLNTINQSLIEQSNPGIYTQAMMELGAMICRPKKPKCEACPLINQCAAFQKGLTNILPVLSKIKEKKEIKYITLIIHDFDGIYLRKRTEKLLYGMYEYPQFESDSTHQVLCDLEESGTLIEITSEGKRYKHVFTHQIWKMNVYYARLIKHASSDWKYIKNSEINNIPMAIAHQKIHKN